MRKILFILSNLSGGGAEKAFVDLMKHTDYAAYDITLCLARETGKYLDQIPPQVKVVVLFPGKSFWYKLLLGLSKYLNLDGGMKYWVRHKVGKGYDVMVSFMEGIPMKIHGYLIDRARKNVSWIHTNLFSYHYTKKYFYNDKAERGNYIQMDNLFFVSQGACNNFHLLFPLNNRKNIVYNPVDKEEIIRKSLQQTIKKRRFTICAVGRLIDAKRYDRLLRVARVLAERECAVDFWIVGEGTLKRDLIQLQRELNLQEYVHFWGFQANPYPYMASADVFLNTSQVEGYPLVICEALCLGKPVVATDVAGSAEVLGDAGILTAQDDQSIFEALYSLIQTPEKVAELSKLAVERSEIFDINKKVAEIYQLLE